MDHGDWWTGVSFSSAASAIGYLPLHLQLTVMDDEEFGARLKKSVGTPELWKLRRNTAMTVGRCFHAAGDALLLAVDTKDSDHQQITAFSMLLRMAGELAIASAKLLASGQHYAGAALLRQIVEIEYLTWTFKERYRNPEKWLQSTHEERMKDFSPAQLRKTSHGRFLSQDYQHHCEQGGHPVPRGAHLLGGENKGGAQLLLVDLLTHWHFSTRARNRLQCGGVCPRLHDLRQHRVVALLIVRLAGSLARWPQLALHGRTRVHGHSFHFASLNALGALQCTFSSIYPAKLWPQPRICDAGLRHPARTVVNLSRLLRAS